MAAWRGDIDWGDFFGDTDDFYKAMDNWKNAERVIDQYKEALEQTSIDGKVAIDELSKSFKKPKEAIQSLQKELKELQDSLSIGAHGIQIVTPELSADLAKIKELQKDLEILQELVAYNYEVETLKRLGDTLGYVQQKTNEAVKAQEEFQDMLNASPYDPNMGEFDFESKTRDAALKSYDNQKKLLDDFVNYSKSKYDEERENVNETFRQLYIAYKDNVKVREELREALVKRLAEIDKLESDHLQNELLKRIDMTRNSYNQMYANILAFQNAREAAIQEVTGYTNSPFENEIAAEKAKYKKMLEYAKEYGLDVKAVRDQHAKNIMAIMAKEAKRQQDEYEAQVRAAQEAAKEKLRIQQELDLEMIGNLDAVNYTEKERRMQVDKDLYNQTKQILKDRTDAEEQAQAALVDDHKRATLTQKEYEFYQLDAIYEYRKKILGSSIELEEWYAEASKNIAEDTSDYWKDAFTGWANDFSKTLNDALWDAEFTFSKMLESFGKMITQMVIQKSVVEPIAGAITSTNLFSSTGNLFGFASGGVFGNISAASNSVVTQPTAFSYSGLTPFASGGGVMGEAGPEAVMPLTRTPSGDLGVKAESSGPQDVKVEIINKTGQDIKATQAKTTFDMKRMVIGVVLEGIQDNTMGIRRALGGA
jgi:lambda family phage tail tape measure protein